MPAVAHRDGCHAAHSCPSDTGSYVCGDTGNYSECPVTTETTVPDVDTTVPDVDYDAPAMPRLGKAAAGAKGAVKFTIVAERRSKIAVTENGKTVARATGTGSRQTIRFSARTGSHSYRGHRDRPRRQHQRRRCQFRSPSTPTPRRSPRCRPAPPPPPRVPQSFSFTTEPGATYTLAVKGQKTHPRHRHHGNRHAPVLAAQRHLPGHAEGHRPRRKRHHHRAGPQGRVRPPGADRRAGPPPTTPTAPPST